MNGTLYGIGAGPGDPELMTLKAVRIVRACPVIAVPAEKKEDSVAYRIAAGAVEGLAKKPCLAVPMPMTKDRKALEDSRNRAAERIAEILRQGKDAAFLTLGDPTVYSTYMYVHRILQEQGFRTVIIPGIPSFCAAAAAFSIPLAEASEQIHIIPSSYDFAAAAALPGTRVFMKAGRKMPELQKQLHDAGGEIYLAENCTMADEKLLRDGEALEEAAAGSYFSTIILKGRGN